MNFRIMYSEKGHSRPVFGSSLTYDVRPMHMRCRVFLAKPSAELINGLVCMMVCATACCVTTKRFRIVANLYDYVDYCLYVVLRDCCCRVACTFCFLK